MPAAFKCFALKGSNACGVQMLRVKRFKCLQRSNASRSKVQSRPISLFSYFPIFHFQFPESLIFSYLCSGDNLFYRIPACPRVRKVRTTQSAILPNGKVLRLNTVGTASATENIPSRFGVIRVKTRGKSPRLVAVMQHEGKPYGLKDQIYRE
jgi:hypothetical protein